MVIMEVDFRVRMNMHTSKFGLTELIIGVSKAKCCEECACDLGFGVAPPKLCKNVVK